MSISVEHAQILLQTPEILSNREGSVTVATPSFTGSVVTFAGMVAITAAGPALAGSVVGLSWEQDTATIDVAAALPTFAPQNVGGLNVASYDAAAITLVGSEVAFELGTGGATTNLPVVESQITFATGNAALEIGRYFDSVVFPVTGSDCTLRLHNVVTAAAPSFTGSTVTLTLTAGISTFVEFASPSLLGQTIGLEKTWSDVVTAAAPSFVGSNISLDWQIEDGVVVQAASAEFGLTGSEITANQGFNTASAYLSVTGSDIGLFVSNSVTVSAASYVVTGQEVSLSFTFTLGIAVEPAQPTITGSEIGLILGSGAPTRATVTHLVDFIHISLGAPYFASDATKESIVDGTGT